MSELGTCDLCDKPARWAVVVKGCSEHKIALKAAVENCNSNQQLKAEIRAISEIIDYSGTGIIQVDFAQLKRRLRELSAV
jgi:predicted YcjX-like family ATPase